jgi:hypothetical protein
MLIAGKLIPQPPRDEPFRCFMLELRRAAVLDCRHRRLGEFDDAHIHHDRFSNRKQW